jgi:putative DNA primase/helicase
MNFASKINFDELMTPVAARLLDKPNTRLSKPPRDVRFGAHGSMSINYETGQFFDHESKIGGGVIDLVKHKTGLDHAGAVSWLRREGLLPAKPTGSALASRPKPEAKSARFVCSYDYVGASGALLHQTVRYADPKTFRQRRPGAGHGQWIWNLDEINPVLYRLPDVLKAVTEGRTVYVVEGEKDANNLTALGLVATTNAMGARKWKPHYSETLRGADVVIIGDTNDVGRKHVQEVATALHGIAKRVRALDLAAAWPECPEKGDISNWLEAGGTADQLAALVEALPDWAPDPSASDDTEWPEPRPLPVGLAPVEEFSSDFMPEALAPWIDDIANRLQCAPDYVAVAAITALGATIGRRVGIKPQMKTDWTEVPNIWGGFIGRPGLLKSPAMSEALKPIHRLEAEAAKENEVAAQAYAAGISAFKLRQQVQVTLQKEALKKNARAEINLDVGEEPKVPVPLRYRTNDTSYEALAELLISNPSGVLVERDELVSLLRHLDRDEQAVARGFYLSGWSGMQPYTLDRIGRGHRHVDAVCISVLGNTQPARISEYVRRANRGGAGGDGLIQRFGLLVWPDTPPDWRDVDEYPQTAARERAFSVYQRASELNLASALALGAKQDAYDKIPHFRFSPEAHEDFLGWREGVERRLRSGEMSPALEGHIAKYRKLVPAIALINHLTDADQGGAISKTSLLRALAFATYLESHARRVYGSGTESELAAAQAILKHIRGGDLKDGFTARDVHRPRWAHLTDHEQVAAGLTLLVDLDYLAERQQALGPQGGRPKTTYMINPRGPR